MSDKCSKPETEGSRIDSGVKRLNLSRGISHSNNSSLALSPMAPTNGETPTNVPEVREDKIHKFDGGT